jgi:hypothetical protein
MRMSTWTPIAWLALLVLPMATRAGEVIAHPEVELNSDDIRNVYLGEKQWIGGLRLVPVSNSAIEPRFLAEILQTDAAKFQARWVRKRFREGMTPPPTKGSDAEVIFFVRSTPGAIGYISGSVDGVAGVKVLEKF